MDQQSQIYLAIAVSASAGKAKDTYDILNAALPLIHKCEMETGNLTLYSVVSLVLAFSPETTGNYQFELVLDFFLQCFKFSKIANEDTFAVDVSLDSVLNDVRMGDFIQTSSHSLEQRIRSVQLYAEEACAQLQWLGSDICHKLMMGHDESLNKASFQFVKSVIFKTDSLGLSATSNKNILSRMGKLNYEPFDIWYNDFYSPITEIAKFVRLPTLLEWEKMNSSEKISTLLSQGITERALPFATRLLTRKIVTWQDFNQWLLQFGKKNIPKNFNSVYAIVVDLVESDYFLRGLRDDTVQFHRFVSIVLCVLYACPSRLSSDLDSMTRLVTAFGNVPETVDKVDNISFLPQIPSHMIQPSQSCIGHLQSLIYISLEMQKSLLQTYELCQGSADVQYNEMTKFVARERPNWERIVTFLKQDQACFSRVSRSSKDSFLLSTLLESPAEIAFLPMVQHIISLTTEETESIIVEKCWQSYLGSNLISMTDVYPLVDLLEKQNYQEGRQIQSLLDAASELSRNFKVSLVDGLSFTPRQLYETHDKWLIVQKVLDTNPRAYLERKRLFSIVTLLGIGFNDGEAVNTQLDLSNPYYVKLLVSCVQSALRDENFTFAYEHSMRLLDSHYTNDVVSQNWLVFFRVGQYLSETRTTMALIEKQLALLSKLLLVVPSTFNRQVMDQWCLLEVELSTRVD